MQVFSETGSVADSRWYVLGETATVSISQTQTGKDFLARAETNIVAVGLIAGVPLIVVLPAVLILRRRRAAPPPPPPMT